MKKEKKVFVVLVTDPSFDYLEFPAVFHIRALGAEQAEECAKEIFKEDYYFDEETIEEELEFDVYELKDSDIIDA